MPLHIIVPKTKKELYSESKNEFIQLELPNDVELVLEHSLVSISKWESKWHKPFLSKESKTMEETLDYIKCMTITQNVNPDVYLCLTDKNVKDIKNYIDDPMTATTIKNRPNGPRSREIVTSELIYYWMITLGMDVEVFQKWHLNRLLTLIGVCNIKNTPPKKMSRGDAISRNAALNAANRRRLHSKG